MGKCCLHVCANKEKVTVFDQSKEWNFPIFFLSPMRMRMSNDNANANANANPNPNVNANANAKCENEYVDVENANTISPLLSSPLLFTPLHHSKDAKLTRPSEQNTPSPNARFSGHPI